MRTSVRDVEPLAMRPSRRPPTNGRARRTSFVAAYCFYDGECQMCQGAIRRFGGALRQLGVRSLPLQQSPMASLWPPARLLHEMQVWTGRRLLGGAQGIAWLCGRCWFLAPLPWLMWLPGISHGAVLLYRKVAERRSCVNGSCAIPGANSVIDRADNSDARYEHQPG